MTDHRPQSRMIPVAVAGLVGVLLGALVVVLGVLAGKSPACCCNGQACCQAVGCETTAILSYDSSKLSNVVAGEVSCCLVDLSSIEAAAISVAVESLRTRFPDAKLVAFGPHVQENRLQAAAHAGCDPVLTRGQLNANLAGYLRQWLGSVS